MYGTLISSVTVGAGGASTINFTSIPTDGTYTDLCVLVSGRSTDANMYLGIKFNNSATSDYSRLFLFADGSSPQSGSVTGATSMTASGLNNRSDQTANTFGSTQYYIPNYALTRAKSVSADAVTENNSATSYLVISAGLRTTTDAITSITLTPGYGNFAQYSTAYLYGLTKGSGGATAS